jgi:hypothetical protein
MPKRYNVDGGFKIPANSTQHWTWRWPQPQGQPPGPNRGPVIFRALPKGPGGSGNNTAKNALVTYDIATCRGVAGSPEGPQVFYEFKIRNESSVDVPFNLDIVTFGDLTEEPDADAGSGGPST